MKRKLLFILFICLFAAFVFSSMLIVGGCGGGGGGGGGILPAPSSTPTPLATGTFTKTDSLGSDAAWGAPFTTDVEVHEQHLFFAQDIKGSGYIESFSLRYENFEGVSTNCPDVTIKMGHTSLSALTTTFANNVEQGRGSLETVFTGSLTIPAGSAGDYFTIALDTPFHYNGVDNLVVEIVRTAACDNHILLDSTDLAYTDVSLHKWDSGAATGDLYEDYINAKFTFAGGDNAIEFGGANQNYWPFSSELPRTQHLYLASEIDGSGPITGIGLQLDQATATAETYTYTVKMGHTSLSALGTTYDSNYNVGSPVTVANNATFTIPAGIPAGSYFWVPLPDGSFSYNGTDNLIVEFDISAGTTAGTGIDVILRVLFGVAGRRAYGSHGNATANDVDDTMHHIKFRFNGGTMDVMTPNGMTSGSGDGFPFFNTDGRRQWLYRTGELGTKGTINKIEGRVWSSGGAADTGFTYTVFMSHTTATTLGTDFAANLPSPVMVFNGTFNIPAVSGGDWIEIPLSTSFNYNGTDNLVVEIGGTGGTGAAAAFISDSVTPTLYTSRRLFAPASTDATGTLTNSLIDMRFTLE